VILPAWTEVWISPDPAGHLQATGRDARGRKQYRYHAGWSTVRDATKFDRMNALASALPRLRRQLDAHLGLRDLGREKVLAAVVTLLETTCIRVGNEEYCRENGAYGLTTLRKRHVELGATRIRFEFPAKGGKVQRVTVRNRRLARLVLRCEELPGRRLFQYLSDDGERRNVGSADVNEYLREIIGEPFTAKDFRTWWGSVLALDALRKLGPAGSEREAEANIVRAVDQVAAHLANTRAVCRRFYVHPAILERYANGTLFDLIGAAPRRARRWMDAEEVALAIFLDAVHAS
jgi:DNA topoisomerase-1